MNYYKMERDRQHPRKGASQTVLKVLSVIIAIAIVAIVARLDARADVAPKVIYQETNKASEQANNLSEQVNNLSNNLSEHANNASNNASEQAKASTNAVEKKHDYSDIAISDAEMEELKRIVAAEAQTQSMEGREAVVEVIFNRVLSPEFPNTVHGVLSQKGQFATWRMRNASWVVPDAAVAPIEWVLEHGRTVLPDTSYVYFDTRGTNGRKHIKIGAHYFGR